MARLDPAVERFLEAARVARLATVDGRGRPHVVPVVFAFAAGKAYTPIDLKPKSAAPRRLRRVRNIEANSQVQLLVDRYDEDWRRLAYVQLRGRASLIEAGYEYRRALRLLERKYPQYKTLPLAGRPVIRIEVEDVVSWGDLRVAAGAPRDAGRIAVDAVKRAKAGSRVSFDARVLRLWTDAGVRSALVGDASGLTRVEAGRRALEAGRSYALDRGVVREYEGGWRNVVLDARSRARRLDREVPVSVTEQYIDRVEKILRGVGKARARRRAR